MGLTRPLTIADHAQVLPLYAVLGGSSTDPDAFETILSHPGTTIWGSFDGDMLKAMTTLHILPNLTQNGRPYALIENVASLPSARGQGHARDVMQAAINAAWIAGAYKIMLLTGQDTGAKGFYEQFGFRADQKFGMQLRRVPARKP
ncbi:GNAT family N-acetyltransferase [uncultured Tateyamaria sp.]|uniref:GNAT family N-acetyltransferase n=1 Tax=uncultured Tateyamaria sp. TaxID=455651 RepID=UPI00261E2F64|nr:GNAT family N-acetyltransferase [uncultured Tateyamaria sp.]